MTNIEIVVYIGIAVISLAIFVVAVIAAVDLKMYVLILPALILLGVSVLFALAPFHPEWMEDTTTTTVIIEIQCVEE